ncbi:magnesium transporter [Colwellia sp. MEBiC06753]
MDNKQVSVNIDELIVALSQETVELPEQYAQLNAFEWAGIFESLTNDQRLILLPNVDSQLMSGILSEMREDARLQFLSVLPQRFIEKTIRSGSNVEAVDILETLPAKAASKIIKKLAPAAQSQIETSLSYSDDQVGRYTDQQVYTVDVTASVSEVITELKQTELATELNNIIVVDSHLSYLGEVSLKELFNSDIDAQIADIVHPSDKTIDDETGLLEASNLVRGSQRSYLPVVREDGRFIGIFSIHDALHVFQEYYEGQMAHLGQVSDEDLFAPVNVSAKRRATWLGINLLTAFLASMVIGLFDKVLVEVVALAVLMPIVASMGGITGSQSLTLTVRGLATGQVSQGNLKVLRDKELWVAVINSGVWAVLVAFICFYWFNNGLLAFIIAGAIVVNMVVAALAGVFIPVILEKVGIDPAIAGSVILTTVTDVVGFFVFLGSATVIFLA